MLWQSERMKDIFRENDRCALLVNKELLTSDRTQVWAERYPGQNPL